MFEYKKNRIEINNSIYSCGGFNTPTLASQQRVLNPTATTL